jgi:fatty-acyl-CoA synthase
VNQGEEGELWFAGPGITPGYWGNPEATRDAFADGAWLKSGDIGRQDADGYYYIAGRIKEMFISGGENVYPAEVENVLAAHPDILEAAVVAIADDKWGEVGRAYVLARPGHEIPPAAEITSFCRDRLAPYKVPKEFVSVQDFPRTAAGKIQKHLLGARDES